MKLLELKSVFKKYGDQHVLNGISISFENGKIYLIKGRSGCGKSTLLNICSLLENPDRGEVFFKGTETKKLSEIERKEILRGHIGYIFQDYNLFEELSVYHNLQIYLLSITRKSIAEMDKMIKEQLMNNGAVTVSIYFSQEHYDDDSYTFFCHHTVLKKIILLMRLQ